MKTKYWQDRPPKERCYAGSPPDWKILPAPEGAGSCLRKGDHPGEHRNATRRWKDGDRTSQPLDKKVGK